MRFSAPVGLAKIFHTTGFVELESLLSDKEASVLLSAIDKTLSKRLGMTRENLLKLSPFELYKASHDLSQTDDSLRKIICSKKFAEIVYEISGEKPIRFGYDQAFRVGENKSKERDLFTGSLKEISSLQGSLFGLMLTLRGSEESSPPFSETPGNGVLLSADFPLCLDTLYKAKDQCYLLVVFTGKISVVLFKKDVPHPYAFKQLGYFSGDKLSDESHPILFR